MTTTNMNNNLPVHRPDDNVIPSNRVWDSSMEHPSRSFQQQQHRYVPRDHV